MKMFASNLSFSKAIIADRLHTHERRQPRPQRVYRLPADRPAARPATGR